MKKLLLALASGLFAVSAHSAGTASHDGHAASSSTKGASGESARSAPAASADKRPDSSGDRPDLKQRSSSGSGAANRTHAEGSGSGVTGGPAATQGHTGSTTNTSNSPGK